MSHKHTESVLFLLFFLRTESVTGGPHITASPFLRESLTNADMFCINRDFLFVGVNAGLMISSVVIAHFGEVLKHSVSQFSVQH